ncbi:MAG: IS3 family transposase, partial [Anaerobutyricum sp.]
AAAQTPLHKMYTFVYRTFIKFILFCRGQALFLMGHFLLGTGTGCFTACEGFFGRMKNEMFYGEKWDKISVEEFISIINQYMQWYRDKRIKLSLGGLSPMEYRRSLGIA